VILYLLRHGDAVAASVDPARPLSNRGQVEIQRIAQWAKNDDVHVAEIRHSGKQRALETAQMIAMTIEPERGIREVRGLKPDDDVEPVAKVLEAEVENMMLVGHLPFMGVLASLLLRNDRGHGLIAFPTGGLVAIGRTEDGWSLHQTITPASLPDR